MASRRRPLRPSWAARRQSFDSDSSDYRTGSDRFQRNPWDDHVVTVDLNTPEATRSILAAQRSATAEFVSGPSHRRQSLDIVAATFYEGGDGSDDSTFRLTAKSKDVQDGTDSRREAPTTAARWM
jgi:hypothetical protein